MNAQFGREIVTNLQSYSGERIYELSLADIVAKTGEGMNALVKYVREKDYNAEVIKEKNKASFRFEMYSTVNLWVHTILAINEKRKKMISRLIELQEIKFNKS